jgi:CHAT domain-containing protein/lipopolysaccharide biosynthesis regulator YciM
MIRVLLALLFLLGWCCTTLAQEADTTLAKQLYNQGSELHENGQLVEGKKLYEQSLALYKKANDWENYFMVIYDLCLIGVSTGDLPYAIELSEKSIQECEQQLGKANASNSDLHNMLGMACSMNGDFLKSIEVFQKGLEIDIEYRGVEDPIVGQDYNNVALAYHKNGQYEIAVNYYQQALNHKAKYGAKEESLARAYLNVSAVYAEMGEFQLSLKYSLETLKRYQNVYGEDSRHTEGAYQNVGRAYRSIGELEKAREYLEKGLSIAKEIYAGEAYSYLLANSHMNLAAVWEQKEQLPKALEHYLKAFNIRKSTLGIDNPETLEVQERLANIYLQTNQLELAEKMIRAVFNQRKKSLAPDHFKLSFSYHYLGQLALKSRSEDPQPHFRKALEICKQSYGEKHPRVAYFNRMLAESHLANSQADSALVFVKRSFEANQKESGEVMSYLEWYESLLEHYNVSTQLYQQTGDQQLLIASLELVKKCEETFTNARNEFFSESDKMTLSEYIHQVFFAGIKLCDLLHQKTNDRQYNELAHRFSENSKSALVLINLNKRKAVKVAGIPDSILQKERVLVRKINQLKSGNTSLEKEDELFEANREYEAYTADLKTNYPKYYEAKYTMPMASIENVKAKLIPNAKTAVVTFFYNEEVFINVYTKSQFKFISQRADQVDVSELVRELQQAIKTKSDEAYRTAAHKLYQLLIEPVEQYFVEQNMAIERLILVPDGILGHVPFDVLLTEETNNEIAYRDYPYLLRKYIISNNFSLRLAIEAKQKKKHSKNMLIGFAPEFAEDKYVLSYAATDEAERERGTIQNLPGATLEVESITAMLKGEHCLSSCATESSFRAKANQFRVLHLATHALVDDVNPDYSKLVFSDNTDSTDDGFLHVFELYNMQLNADLVTLSACNTGFGTIRKGEGVMSLARGFAYAGCPNLVMSLWPASDQSTAKLMQLFYKGIKEGKAIDEALRAAKLSYLESASDLGAHPFYWSGFVFIGNPDPIIEAKKSNASLGDLLLYAIISLASLAGAIYFFRRSVRLKKANSTSEEAA